MTGQRPWLGLLLSPLLAVLPTKVIISVSTYQISDVAPCIHWPSPEKSNYILPAFSEEIMTTLQCHIMTSYVM